MSNKEVDNALSTVRTEQQTPGLIPEGELSCAVEVLVKATTDTYSRQSQAYAQARNSQPWDEDARMTALMLSAVRSRLVDGTMHPLGEANKWKLLDVGAGYGRDALRFGKEPDIAVTVLDNAAGFVESLLKLQSEGQIAANSVVSADMRDMSALPSSSFNCVRNHATLHHLPLLHQGLGADAAVEESRRVLVSGGVFYVLVKAGENIDMIDTNEGLGGRFFQLFTTTSLSELLTRYRFRLFHLQELMERRGGTDIPWVFALAEAI